MSQPTTPHPTRPQPAKHRPAKHRITGTALRIMPIAWPLVVAVVMAVWFKNPALLAFGVMSPVMALTRWVSTKNARADTEARRAEETAAKEHQRAQRVVNDLAKWQQKANTDHPPVSTWLAEPLWRPADHTPGQVVRIGTHQAPLPSDYGVRGGGEGTSETTTSEIGSAAVSATAEVPLTIALHTPLAVVGRGFEDRQVWRAMWAQAAAIVSQPWVPGRISVSAWWAEHGDVPDVLDIPVPGEDRRVRWSFVDNSAAIPADVTWVVMLAGSGMAHLYHRGVVVQSGFRPDRLSTSQSRWARARLVANDTDTVETKRVVDPDDRGGLWADISPDCPPLDLVRQGPHTLVWGKTGSGKSVLLTAMIASLTRSYPPRRVGLVGIDFKGGATLLPLITPPHGKGLLTDLTPARHHRVTRSLAAEITRRETLFGHHGVASWEDLPHEVVCPRLVVVVDEAGVVAHDAPALMAVLADIATRGRSLGMHLLLATQRPHQLPGAVIANCSLRLCLGVTDATEASQLLPDVDPELLATLRRSPPGTVLAPTPRGSELVRVGSSGGSHTGGSHTVQQWEWAPGADGVGEGGGGVWLEELPEKLPGDFLERHLSEGVEAAADFVIGLGDYPDRQEQTALWYRPGRDGPLVVIGDAGSGHTSSLSHIAHQASEHGARVIWGSGRIELLCHQLMRLDSDLAASSNDICLVIDRLDRVLGNTSPESATWVLDTLQRLASVVVERGGYCAVVVSAAAGTTSAQALLRWGATVCLLRHRDQTLWAVGGGDPALFSPDTPPGRGVIASTLVQWCESDTYEALSASLSAAPETLLGKPDPAAVVVVGSGAADALAGGNPTGEMITVMQAEARWAEIRSAVDSGVGVVFSGVAVSVMRQLIGPGHTTPPVSAPWPTGWWVRPGGVELVRCS